MAGPSYRVTHTVNEYEPTYGLLTRVIDEGDVAVGSDDRCTTNEYTTANTDAWIVGRIRQTWLTTCAASPTGADVLGPHKAHSHLLRVGFFGSVARWPSAGPMLQLMRLVV
jgi:hypothetical protein